MLRVEFLYEFHLVIKMFLIEYIQKVNKIIIIDQKLVSTIQIRLLQTLGYRQDTDTKLIPNVKAQMIPTSSNLHTMI